MPTSTPANPSNLSNFSVRPISIMLQLHMILIVRVVLVFELFALSKVCLVYYNHEEIVKSFGVIVSFPVSYYNKTIDMDRYLTGVWKKEGFTLRTLFWFAGKV